MTQSAAGAGVCAVAAGADMGPCHVHFCNPLTLYPDLVVMSNYCSFIGRIQQTETDVGLLIVKQIHMSDSKLIHWRINQLL